MIAISRFSVADGEAEEFAGGARAVLEALAERPGFVRGHVGRNADDPALWALVTEWDGAGFYRRALSDFTVRMVAMPLLSRAIDEPGAYEILATRPAPAPAGGA
ncbi:MAG: antibiotic biosynthesis monooxygenase [Streptosporangiales bacterium]|nr:antibiotic biosynthesis monooxygenase [Streptosporangiales bacterium]